ncbi:GDSL-type esterase/lipase family protein [Planococcus sp. YIM B11945]|uniref:GDSL-type esterase/lipase family protein n=1 Tax=Planococcus sp. YIM B11945 TaxID=3435410 RepID=UPI003D7CD078
MSKLARIFIVFLMVFSLPVSSAFANGYHNHGKDSLVALGDSIPFGLSPHRDNDRPANYAFPYLIGDKADVRVHNLGIPGLQTDDLLGALETNKKFRQTVRQAEFVTVTIGGNDFLEILNKAKAESRGNSKLFHQLLAKKLASSDVFDDLREIIHELRSLSDGEIVLYNVYNPFQVKDPLHRVADQYLPEINEEYEELADDFRDVELTDAYKAFGNNQEKFVIRGDIHPTKAGHVKLAKIGFRAFERDYTHHH